MELVQPVRKREYDQQAVALILHLNGMPGTGKLTVARILSDRLNARLVDNHSIINEVIKKHSQGSPEYMRAVMEETGRILGGGGQLIFTNALAAENPKDRARLDQIAEHARRTGQIFWQILLNCELAENQRRLLDPQRRELQKLDDPEVLAQLHLDYSIYHPPATHHLELDTSERSAAETAELILEGMRDLDLQTGSPSSSGLNECG